MRKKPKPASTLTSNRGGSNTDQNIPATATVRRQFVAMAGVMSMQLLVVVLVPIIGGVELDKALGVSYLLFVGLAVALISTVLVMWRTMQVANRLPVPKLTDAQRQAVRKAYEAEDDD